MDVEVSRSLVSYDVTMACHTRITIDFVLYCPSGPFLLVPCVLSVTPVTHVLDGLLDHLCWWDLSWAVVMYILSCCR